NPTPNVAAPTSAPNRPSHTPAVPRAALMGVRSRRRRRRRRHARGMLGDVVLGVLHHDAVAGEGVALEATFEHDGDPGLEQLGRIALVAHGDDDALALDVERHAAGGLLHGAADDVALDAEAAVAELLALGHGLVGGAEVEGGVAQATHEKEPESRQHHQADDDGPASTLAATGGAMVAFFA